MWQWEPHEPEIGRRQLHARPQCTCRLRHGCATCVRAGGRLAHYSASLCNEPQEGCGFRAPAATGLDSGNDKVAARRARQLGVGVATLAPCCELESEALAWLAGAGDGANAVGTCANLLGEWQQQVQAAEQHPELWR